MKIKLFDESKVDLLVLQILNDDEKNILCS